jgi:hypothetical protein
MEQDYPVHHCISSHSLQVSGESALPMKRMERKHELRNISRAGKLDRMVIRQLTRGGGDRVSIPAGYEPTT